MARGGINKAIVQKARESLLARGENPSIDAVRIELGNTGSKTTIHRYLKEIEDFDPRPRASRERLSDELTELVAGLLERMTEEGGEALAYAQARFDEQRIELEQKVDGLSAELTSFQREVDTQKGALALQADELQICQTSLQAELTRNARLSQSCADLEVRVHEKDGQIRSLEEKHSHARDALEHYRSAVKDQRDQEQRRHEGQVQQVQVELRQLQQTLMLKQDELTRLNRDNERLLSEARQLAKAAATHEDAAVRLAGEIATMKTAVAKADGAKEALQEQLGMSRAESKRLEEGLSRASAQLVEATRLSLHYSAELTQLRQAAGHPHTDNESSTR
ncbi:integrase [Pseudomonas sp. ADAK2]|uniref:DNA-binding protein n=1 Tax=unclassified Pseudomonas TaxID=196821 RepID=UPI001463890F|nr:MULTISPECIES: DNA-binding protein [unclassified Pseudomonas]QJI40102.1 integrase [Pseudomonas sp. ADAK7]QJI46407.1 integrase [Pseudomonas sp. ADAK2]